MSDNTPPKTSKRAAAVVLGGLVAGAVLGASAAAANDPNTPIREQFNDAFTPGQVSTDPISMLPIIVTDG